MNDAINKILMYQTSDGQTRIDVKLQDNAVWLTQLQMAELLETTKQNISLHIKNVFEEGELFQEATVKEYLYKIDLALQDLSHLH